MQLLWHQAVAQQSTLQFLQTRVPMHDVARYHRGSWLCATASHKRRSTTRQGIRRRDARALFRRQQQMHCQHIQKHEQVERGGSRAMQITARTPVARLPTARTQHNLTQIAPMRPATAGPAAAAAVLVPAAVALVAVPAVLVMGAIRITVGLFAVHLHTAQTQRHKMQAVLVCPRIVAHAVRTVSRTKLLGMRALQPSNCLCTTWCRTRRRRTERCLTPNPNATP